MCLFIHLFIIKLYVFRYLIINVNIEVLRFSRYLHLFLFMFVSKSRTPYHRLRIVPIPYPFPCTILITTFVALFIRISHKLHFYRTTQRERRHIETNKNSIKSSFKQIIRIAYVTHFP